MKKSLLFFFLLVVGLSSCKKYPEDPLFHFSTAKARVTNIWNIQLYQVNGTDQTALFNTLTPNYRLSLLKDNTFTETSNVSGIALERAGTWSLVDGKNNLTLTYLSSNFGTVPGDGKFQIIKLTKNELWVNDLNATDDIEIHLIPAP